jgi:hypothetical protein
MVCMLLLPVWFEGFYIVLSLYWNSVRAYKICLYIRTSQNREFVFIAMLSTSTMVRATLCTQRWGVQVLASLSAEASLEY